MRGVWFSLQRNLSPTHKRGTAMESFPFLSLFSLSWLGRLLLIIYGTWHDRNHELKYTDIDYTVFSDASLHVTNGGSPYDRDTYRYTPLLAWGLLPNHYLSPHYGKILFITLDVLVAACVERILATERVGFYKRFLACLVWLLNPVTAVVSSRGNAESLLALIMLLCLYFLNTRRVILSGVLYGLAVHMKLYPVIHCLAFYLAVDRTPWRWVRNGIEISNVDKTPRKRSGKRFNVKVTPSEADLRRDKISNVRKTPCLRTDAQVRKSGKNDSLWARARDRIGEISIDWGSMLSYKRVQFVLVSSGTFFSLGLIFYMMYGWEFIEETYLYHVKRTDTKHNFSLYFYVLFVTQRTWLASLLSKVAFVPQFLLLSLSSLLLYKDVAFCLFVQTFVFVAFNKVVTSQVRMTCTYTFINFSLPPSSLSLSLSLSFYLLCFFPCSISFGICVISH